MGTLFCDSKIETVSVGRFLCNFWMWDVIWESLCRFKNVVTSKPFGLFEKKIKIVTVGSRIEKGTIYSCHNYKASRSPSNLLFTVFQHQVKLRRIKKISEIRNHKRCPPTGKVGATLEVWHTVMKGLGLHLSDANLKCTCDSCFLTCTTGAVIVVTPQRCLRMKGFNIWKALTSIPCTWWIINGFFASTLTTMTTQHWGPTKFWKNMKGKILESSRTLF